MKFLLLEAGAGMRLDVVGCVGTPRGGWGLPISFPECHQCDKGRVGSLSSPLQ